jgi:probable phosphoglycerate mutase
MNGRRVYFIRHGETEDNAKHIYTGQSDTPLNNIGRKQAREAVPHISTLYITHILASDLARSVETAEIIAQGIGFPAELIQTTADLREVDVGSLAGQPDRGRRHIAAMRRHDPGIETREHVFARLRHLIVVLPSDGNILLVGHQGSGAFLRAIVDDVDPLDIEGLGNGTVVELQVPDV